MPATEVAKLRKDRGRNPEAVAAPAAMKIWDGGHVMLERFSVL
jgi:hypothetical protein